MSERKVLNKYIPPDFDPLKVPRSKRDRNAQYNIRIMMPMNVRCDMCGEFIVLGKKFNSRMESVSDERYLGLRIFRFYVRCPKCHGELTIKTDPKSADYVCEHNCHRLQKKFWDDLKVAKQERRQKFEAKLNGDSEGDAMQQLEKKTFDAREEMAQMTQLDEIRAIQARHSRMSTDDLLEIMRQKEATEQATAAKERERAALDAVTVPEDEEARALAEFRKRKEQLARPEKLEHLSGLNEDEFNDGLTSESESGSAVDDLVSNIRVLDSDSDGSHGEGDRDGDAAEDEDDDDDGILRAGASKIVGGGAQLAPPGSADGGPRKRVAETAASSSVLARPAKQRTISRVQHLLMDEEEGDAEEEPAVGGRPHLSVPREHDEVIRATDDFADEAVSGANAVGELISGHSEAVEAAVESAGSAPVAVMHFSAAAEERYIPTVKTEKAAHVAEDNVWSRPAVRPTPAASKTKSLFGGHVQVVKKPAPVAVPVVDPATSLLSGYSSGSDSS